MVIKLIDLGIAPRGAGGDTNYKAFTKVNENFSQIREALGAGEGVEIPNALPVEKGGTGAITAKQAVINLGLEPVNSLDSSDDYRPLAAIQGKKLQDEKLGKNENAASAAKLSTIRSLTWTGDATGTMNFDGSGNASTSLTLKDSGVNAGSYGSSTSVPVLAIDGKGRVTSASVTQIPTATTGTSGLVSLNPAVNSTSDTQAATPSAVKSAYDLAKSAIPKIEKGAPNGVATLDESGLVPASQLPSFVDDILEFPSLEGLPQLGEAGKIYVTIDLNMTYRWTGTTYVTVGSGSGVSSSAIKLYTPRKINNVGFDGTQDITIYDASKLPLAGGTIDGDLRVNGLAYIGKIRGDTDLWVTSEDETSGRRVLTGGLLTSNVYSDAVHVPHLGIYSVGNIATTGKIIVNTPEAQLLHAQSGKYLFINQAGWGVYSGAGFIPLSVDSGGLGNSEGRALSADRLATPRNIFGQNFDGSGDIGGAVTASTGVVQADSFHYIDMGRAALDRMNFYNYGAIFNFIDSQNGNVVARITQNGIDCNAASASRLKTPIKINNVDCNGTQDINIEAPLRYMGVISTQEQLDAAKLDGKYLVQGVKIEGLYDWGILVVLSEANVCHQTFYPHLGSDVAELPKAPNNATMALRQSWNNMWSGWRVVGTRDDSKLPLTGGTISGKLAIGAFEVGKQSAWGIFTSSRLYGTTYANDSPYELEVATLSSIMISVLVTLKVTFTPQSTQVPTVVYFNCASNWSGGIFASGNFIVPAYTSYKVEVVRTDSLGTTLNPTVQQWAERRYA